MAVKWKNHLREGETRKYSKPGVEQETRSGFYDEGVPAHKHRSPKSGKGDRLGQKILRNKRTADGCTASPASDEPGVKLYETMQRDQIGQSRNVVIHEIPELFRGKGRQRKKAVTGHVVHPLRKMLLIKVYFAWEDDMESVTLGAGTHSQRWWNSPVHGIGTGSWYQPME